MSTAHEQPPLPKKIPWPVWKSGFAAPWNWSQTLRAERDAAVAERDAAFAERDAARTAAGTVTMTDTQKLRQEIEDCAASANRSARASKNCWDRWTC